MRPLPHEVVGDFIDAVVRDPVKADAMLAACAQLLKARWLHGQEAHGVGEFSDRDEVEDPLVTAGCPKNAAASRGLPVMGT